MTRDHHPSSAAPGFLGVAWTLDPERQPAVGRRISLILSALVLIGAIPVAYLVSRSSANPKERHAPAVVLSTDPVQRCTANVMGLLARTVQAVQQGYTSGLDPDEVAVQYGAQSPEFRAFVHAQPTLISRIITRGSDGRLPAMQPDVRQECRDWSSPTS